MNGLTGMRGAWLPDKERYVVTLDDPGRRKVGSSPRL